MLCSKFFSLYILSCLFIFKPTDVYGLIDPVTGTLAVGTFVVGYFLHKKSYFGFPFSSCPKMTIDFRELKRDMDKKFFGQHIASKIILSALKGNMHRSKNNKKPLVMSFHGWTGSGKNFITDLIADHVFISKKIKDSRYHVIHGRSDFALQSKLPQYKEVLHKKVISAIKECDTNIFVFDELHYMPMGLLDILIPIFENHDSSVDSRESVFIFLTNAGGNAIVNKYLELWNNGYSREQMEVHNFDLILQKSAFNEIGGLKKSQLIDSHIIDHFVPFLPLEKSHVIQCIEAELRHHGKTIDPEITNDILKIITFGPDPQNIFSTSGCKRINQQVTQYVPEP